MPSVDVENPPVFKKEFPIYYRVEPVEYLRKATYAAEGDFFFHYPARLEDYEELRHIFADDGIFASATSAPTAPEKGVFFDIHVEYVPVSKRASYFLAASYASAAIVPSYNGTSGHIVRYDLYIDTELKQSYEYTITTKQAVWLALLPFYWVNYLTYDLSDAFRATSYQFFLDATLDGYLKPP